jgi:hypothetical protein
MRSMTWLRTELVTQQKARESTYRDHTGRFRAKVMLKPGATRIGSLPRAAARNLKLLPALDGVAAHADFQRKCGISNKLWREMPAPATSRPRPAVVNPDTDSDTDDEVLDLLLGDEDEDDDEDEDEDEVEGAVEDLDEDERADETEIEAVGADEQGGTRSKAARRAERYIAARKLIRDDKFWADTREVLDVLNELLRDLKHADEDRPLMGWVWPMMFSLHRNMSEVRSALCGWMRPRARPLTLCAPSRADPPKGRLRRITPARSAQEGHRADHVPLGVPSRAAPLSCVRAQPAIQRCTTPRRSRGEGGLHGRA